MGWGGMGTVMGHTDPLLVSHSSMVAFSNTSPLSRHRNGAVEQRVMGDGRGGKGEGGWGGEGGGYYGRVLCYNMMRCWQKDKQGNRVTRLM